MTITALHRPLPTQYEVRDGVVVYWGACTCGWESGFRFETVEAARLRLSEHIRVSK